MISTMTDGCKDILHHVLSYHIISYHILFHYITISYHMHIMKYIMMYMITDNMMMYMTMSVQFCRHFTQTQHRSCLRGRQRAWPRHVKGALSVESTRCEAYGTQGPLRRMTKWLVEIHQSSFFGWLKS